MPRWDWDQVWEGLCDDLERKRIFTVIYFKEKENLLRVDLSISRRGRKYSPWVLLTFAAPNLKFDATICLQSLCGFDNSQADSMARYVCRVRSAHSRFMSFRDPYRVLQLNMIWFLIKKHCSQNGPRPHLSRGSVLLSIQYLTSHLDLCELPFLEFFAFSILHSLPPCLLAYGTLRVVLKLTQPRV